MNPRPFPADAITELRFALAESDSDAPEAEMRARVLRTAIGGRSPGRAVDPAGHVDGLTAFRRMTARLAQLLGALRDDQWGRSTVRDLTVQELVGHLIGVEEGFCATLGGHTAFAATDHVDATQPSALAQRGLPPAETSAKWADAVRRTLDAASDGADPDRSVRFHRLNLPLDPFLIVRAFEMWTHEEDIERATGLMVSDPDPETLTRMTDLAVTLLPAGMARAGTGSPATVRLVLTGPGGGTWDVPPYRQQVRPAGGAGTFGPLVVVDSAQFCRVVANRIDLAGSGARTTGDRTAVGELFAGAAALALD